MVILESNEGKKDDSADNVESKNTSSERKELITSMRTRGPGPSRYQMPPTIGYVGHDFTKHKYPAYSMGSRRETKMLDGDITSPGPKYGLDSRIDKNGKEGSPKYSMRPYTKAVGTLESSVPGPGTYHVESVKPMRENRAPAYSIGSRSKYPKKFTVPGPNKYMLPSGQGPRQPVKKSNPAYTMRPKNQKGHFAEDYAKTPGPAAYTPTKMDCYRNKPTSYSCLGKNYPPGDRTRVPGPGAHYPERVVNHLKRAPGFPMGERHSEFVCTMFTIKDVM